MTPWQELAGVALLAIGVALGAWQLKLLLQKRDAARSRAVLELAELLVGAGFGRILLPVALVLCGLGLLLAR